MQDGCTACPSYRRAGGALSSTGCCVRSRTHAHSGALSFSPKAPFDGRCQQVRLALQIGLVLGKKRIGQKETNLRRNVWPYDPILLKHLDHAVAQCVDPCFPQAVHLERAPPMAATGRTACSRTRVTTGEKPIRRMVDRCAAHSLAGGTSPSGVATMPTGRLMKKTAASPNQR
jgi:hypothetical protein